MFLIKAVAEPRGKSATGTKVRGMATGPAPLPKEERQKIWDKAVSNAKGGRTWSIEFSFNGQQISDDGKYRINPIDQPYGKMYELYSYQKGRGYTRAGLYSSMESAKQHAK